MILYLQVVQGHKRPLSFARFMGRQRLVTASVDSSLALWSLNDGKTPTLFRRYKGHINVKNFVGLSVREEDELMACGSEAGQAVAYHRAWSKPLARHPFSASPAASQQQQEGEQQQQAAAQEQAVGLVQEFASAVCWWPEEMGAFGGRCGGPVLAAAKSDGDLRLLTLVSAC